jgi:hydrogenase expression/formation protein HypC
MCLAVPGKIVEANAEEAIVDFLGNRQRVDMTMAPDAAVGEWVLVHAGFAITTISEADAMDTWECLRGEGVRAALEEAGGDAVQRLGGRDV